MDIQKLFNTMASVSESERKNYHLTFGQLIDALKNAPDGCELDPRVKGIGAYRGYYSDLALLTDYTGVEATYNDKKHNPEWGWDDGVGGYIDSQELPRNAKEAADYFESLLGKHTDGYKGGLHEITRDRVLWLASDYGNCSHVAVIGVDGNLQLVTKVIE